MSQKIKCLLGANRWMEFDYVNYKGEKERRKVMYRYCYYGSNDYHPDPEWFMVATDLVKNADRDFAMKDMTNVTTAINRLINKE